MYIYPYTYICMWCTHPFVFIICFLNFLPLHFAHPIVWLSQIVAAPASTVDPSGRKYLGCHRNTTRRRPHPQSRRG